MSRMPEVDVPYPFPPYHMHDSKEVSVSFETDPSVLRTLVPDPLVPNADAVMVFSMGQYEGATSERRHPPYIELSLNVPVSHSGSKGYFVVHRYLDKFEVILAGREIHGWPQRKAALRFIRRDQTIDAEVRREGHRVLMATFQLGDRIEPPAECLSLPFINLKFIPSVQEGAPPDVMQLTSTAYIIDETMDYRTVEAAIEEGSIILDSGQAIPVIDILDATYREYAFTVGHGRVAYDYLAEASSTEKTA